MTAAAPPRGRRLRAVPAGLLPGLLRGLAAAAAGLALWQGLAALAGGFLIAGPAEVGRWLTGNPGLVVRATGATLAAAGAGFLAGNLAAMLLAALVQLWPRADRPVGTLALLVFCLPLVATGPVLRVIHGPGLAPQIAISALAVFYTTFLALRVGLRAVPASWFDLVRSYGRGRASELMRLRARAAVPYLVAGLQIAAPAAFLGAMIGEFTGAERGLGVLTLRAMRELDVAATWGIAAVASAVAMLAYGGLGALGRRLAAPPALILAPPPAAARRGLRRDAAGAALTLAAALMLWQGLMDAFALSPFFAKRPGDVWAFLATAPEAAANRAALAAAFGQTLMLALPGYLAGLMLGAALAAAVTLRPGLARGLLPAAVALRSIPIVVTAPLIVLALGRGAAGTITVVAVMTFFPTLVACLGGIGQTPRPVLDLFSSYAATPWQRLRLAQGPAMLPAFFAAARMAVPAALLAATTAEWLATGIGLGGLMAVSYSTSAWAMLWSAVALLSAAAMLLYLAVERLEARVLRVFGPEQLARP